MQILKRLTVAACLAAITGAVVTAPASAAAVESDGGFAFTCDSSDNANITDYLAASILDVSIPATLTTSGGTNCDVISIDSGAFKENELNSVEIPASVTFIGGEAFAGNELTSVTFLPRTTNLSVFAGAFDGQQNSNGIVTGWLNDSGGLLKAIPTSYSAGDTFTAVYTPIYNVTLDYADGTPTVSYLVPQDTRLDGTEITGPLLTGEKFDILFDAVMDPDHPLTGWKNSAGADWDPATPVTSDITLTAQYGDGSTLPPESLPEWVVTFDPANGTATISTTVKDGATVSAPADPVSGDNGDSPFQGWFDANGSKWDPSTPVTGNATLVAKYTSTETTEPAEEPLKMESVTVPVITGNLFPGGTSTVELNLRFDGETLRILEIDKAEYEKASESKTPGTYLFRRTGRDLEVTGCFVPASEISADGLIKLENLSPGCRTPEPATVTVPPLHATADEASCKPQQVLGQFFFYSAVCLNIHSEPLFLGATTLSADGNATFTFTLPEGFPPGKHTLVFSVAGEEVSVPVTVVPALAGTGPEDAVLLGNAAAMSIALGLYLVFLGRSRKRGFAGRSNGSGMA
ncbi:InlB B-repeat-containing protein [Demequina aurantiaca]|uniref:InlB B-repeat-containing protein n=1 Tax=Demequina aurantiaca TaxID=676200 RepID=UPI000783A497|nr:InlB B-repeat-containing protein [Demequina aurantiaca]